ncbi:MAG: hypothetical protein ACLVIU_01505, partial [Paraclostridium sp.]
LIAILKSVIDYINNKAYELFKIDLDINIVLYSGLCNSAEWVDEYNSKRVIKLFENLGGNNNDYR